MNAHLRAPKVHSSLFGKPHLRHAWSVALLPATGVMLAIVISCSSGPQQPSGPAGNYAKVKANFAQGANEGYDRDIDVFDSLVNANPPNDFTDRARVLRFVIYSGEVQGYKTLAEAYAKGSDTTKDKALKAQYDKLQRDIVQRGAELSLRLGQLAMQLTKDGTVPKNLVLEAPYPAVDVPASNTPLEKVRTGLEIGREDQAQAELIATRTGVLDAVSGLLHADRAAAKSKMDAGPVPLDNTEFRLFVAAQVMTGASFYDSKHLIDPTHYKLLAGVAQDALKPVQAALKQVPDADVSKRVKKLQDQINSGAKAFPSYIS